MPYVEAHIIEPAAPQARKARVFEWIGTFTGLFGAYAIALHINLSAWAFVIYMVSNLCFVTYAIKNHSWGILTLQIGLFGSNVLGIYRWF